MFFKFLLLSFLCWSLSVSTACAQGILVGDMNDDDALNISDVAVMVNTLIGKTEQRRVTPYASDEKSIIGTWYLNELSNITFNEDGTTDYGKGYTYKYDELLGRILFFDADNILVASEEVMDVSEDYIILSPRGEKKYLYYYRTEEMMVKAAHSVLGHEYADLGLSVRWATCNVGADAPYSPGYFFAWGEKDTKASFTQSNYLATSYDPVTANWGGTWRLPTQKEIAELVNSCTWIWYDGVTKKYQGSSTPGYLVVSKDEMYEGNCIFLPVSGYKNGDNVIDGNDRGSYWSSTSNYTNTAVVLNFTSTSVTGSNPVRYVGRQLRGVSPRRKVEDDEGSFGLQF